VKTEDVPSLAISDQRSELLDQCTFSIVELFKNPSAAKAPLSLTCNTLGVRLPDSSHAWTLLICIRAVAVLVVDEVFQ